ncbi:Actin-like protein 7B [Acipenser ruthenus]|uniref:Actin-like protein 7B n=1 Tax=Acipenser ruthenus TaxID=7906 RepID=A0A444V753_ACIRT|nr:Actin-like protein 7B [Acipenser ruthenus]RXM96211.1 Actin-like protein 7B [Acipenser ruthenus]
MGNDVFQVQNLTQKKPIRHGIVVDWDAMERLWHHIFYNELRVAPDDHPIMLTDAPFSPTTNREKATEILFEAFGAPALHMATTALLSLYSCGMTSGLVIGSGAGVSYTCPIQEGKELLSEVRNFAMDYRLPDAMATDSLQKVGPMYRPLVLSRVLVCGDTSKLPGFPERIQAELRASNPGNNKVKVLAAPHRKISSWVGGSILTSLKGFQSLWLKKEDYLEKDACLAHCKFF